MSLWNVWHIFLFMTQCFILKYPQKLTKLLAELKPLPILEIILIYTSHWDWNQGNWGSIENFKYIPKDCFNMNIPHK